MTVAIICNSLNIRAGSLIIYDDITLEYLQIYFIM